MFKYLKNNKMLQIYRYTNNYSSSRFSRVFTTLIERHFEYFPKILILIKKFKKSSFILNCSKTEFALNILWKTVKKKTYMVVQPSERENEMYTLSLCNEMVLIMKWYKSKHFKDRYSFI